jgi:hypothetical protein
MGRTNVAVRVAVRHTVSHIYPQSAFFIKTFFYKILFFFRDISSEPKKITDPEVNVEKNHKKFDTTNFTDIMPELRQIG